MPAKQSGKSDRRGFSYLEIQVAFVLFAVGLSGLGPLAVIQSRQLRRLESRFDGGTTYYLDPSDSYWERKLSAAASVKTMYLAPPPGPVSVIDNGDSGYSELDVDQADWHTVFRANAFQNSFRRQDGAGVGDTAIWQFSELKPGWYSVLVTFAESPDQATDAPYSVYDGPVLLETVRVNQRESPSGPLFEEVPWESLGVFRASSGILRVVLADEATGYVAADAVRVVHVTNQLEVVSLNRSLDADEVTVHISVTVRVP